MTFEKQYKDLMKRIITTGEDRETRTGSTISLFSEHIKVDLNQGFPAVTSKKLAWKSVVGELLWFLSGSTDLSDLRKYTFGEDNGQWSIWTDDQKRWQQTTSFCQGDGDCGDLYGAQWRSQHGYLDNIYNLIQGIRYEANRRDLMVVTWNSDDVYYKTMALKPCHVMFQVYVDKSDKLHLQWYQRSADTFLGLPFNFASYALLTHLLAKWTGKGVGSLSVTLGDAHLYMNQMNSIKQYLENPSYELPSLMLPNGCDSLESTLELTASDFENSLVNYKHAGVVKAPLSVGN